MFIENRRGVTLDFDGTLLRKEIGSVFQIVDRALPSHAEADFKVLRDRYLPLANAGQLSAELQQEWLAETFRIYIRYGLTRTGWQAAIREGAKFRDEALLTLAALRRSGIPTAIVSYGSADFIEFALGLHGAADAVDAVYATRMIHDEEGAVIGVKPETYVTQENKGEWSRRFADLHGIPYENLLAVGDSGGDRYLGHLQENRFGLAKDEADHARISPFMGETAITDGFGPARAWLRQKLGIPL